MLTPFTKDSKRGVEDNEDDEVNDADSDDDSDDGLFAIPIAGRNGAPAKGKGPAGGSGDGGSSSRSYI